LRGRAAAAAAAAARTRPSLAAGSTGAAAAAAAAPCSASPDGASSCSATDLPDVAPTVGGPSHQNSGRDAAPRGSETCRRAFVVASSWQSLLRKAGRWRAAHAREDGGQLALDQLLGLAACGRCVKRCSGTMCSFARGTTT
jgi:hypothetical protein